MKKHIANTITISRVIGAGILFFFSTISNAFITVYVYCGFSDLIDGPIARKLGSTSVLGAYMDTAGDILTYLALLKILFFQSLIPLWAVVWYMTAMFGCFISAIISKIRHGKFYFIHSLFGKILGFSFFILPFAIRWIKKSNLCLGAICIIASIAAVESIYIQMKSKNVITDVTSLKQIANL